MKALCCVVEHKRTDSNPQKYVESTELVENARKTVLESRIDLVGKKLDLEPAKSS